MEDLIHIDKKWFCLTKDGQRFIIAADKEEPYRHVQHKLFLMKIMFLCEVARPRYDTNKNAWFDGKIGIDLDDAAHVPTTTATPTVEMDGEGGENATKDEITNTGV